MDDFNNDELQHFGIPGMKWGIRRYQNYDGTLKHPKGGRRKSKSKRPVPNKEIKKYGDSRDHLSRIEKYSQPRKSQSNGGNSNSSADMAAKFVPDKYKDLARDVIGGTTKVTGTISRRKAAKLRVKRQKALRKLSRELDQNELNQLVNRVQKENALETQLAIRSENTYKKTSNLNDILGVVGGLVTIGAGIASIRKLRAETDQIKNN